MAQPVHTPETTPSAEDLRRSWMNAWRPSTREDDYEITDVEGEIPRELHGTLYRNGPSQKVLPAAGAEALHLFDGDALVHAIRFDDGRAHYRGRFARHETFLREQEEGRLCLDLINVKAEHPLPEDEALGRVQPNTNVIHHGGRLLALVENAPPFLLDPHTLESRGSWDLDGRLLGLSTTAHPKVDGRTGQMLLHGYSPVEPFLTLYVIEPDGRVSLSEVVDAPYGVMMHDVAITENHVIFPLVPVVIDLSVVEQGGLFADAFRHDPDKPFLFGVRGREASAPVRWFEVPTPGFMFHFGNAFEREDKIVLDACFYPDAQGLLDTLRTIRAGGITEAASAYPTLYELDLSKGTCSERRLDDRGAEFPRCDERLVGYENRWGYAVVEREGSTIHDRYFARLVKYDRHGGPSVYHDFGHGTWCGEPVFVPRAPDADEDDGFVLAVRYDGARDESAVVVLDARGFDAKPLAVATLRHRIPQGFHGNFAPGVV